MNNEIIYKQLAKAYKNKDKKLFKSLNKRYGLGIDSIEQIPLVENRPCIDLSMFYEEGDAIYMKNYCTSRFITDMDESVPKHMFNEDRFNIVTYSMFIYEVLSELPNNPNLDEAISQFDFELEDKIVKDILVSNGFVELKNNGDAFVTDYGEMRLFAVNWVGFYKLCLDYFHFYDFEEYMNQYDTGDVVENAHNYLNENLKIAYKRHDFSRLHDVFASKAIVHVSQKEFEQALFNELKLYIVKLNPIYLSDDDLKDYKAIEYPNVNNLDVLSDLAEIDVADIFDKCLNELEIDKILISKDDALSYLNRAWDGEELDELSSEIYDKLGEK